MAIIESNVDIVGTGSWYYTRRKSEFPYCETVHEFRAEIAKICDFRFSQYDVKRGDKVRVTVVGHSRVIRYTGIVDHIKQGETSNWGGTIGYHYTSAAIWIRQNKRVIHIDSTEIDNIEVLE